MKKTFLYSLTIMVLVVFAATPQAQPLSRHILALYSSRLGQTQEKNQVHRNAEVILNHLGCIVDYWDTDKGLPNQKMMQKYFGIITWFYSTAMRQPENYLNWAEKQLNAHKKYVILANIGAFQNSATGELLPIEEINQFTRKMGFTVDDNNFTQDVTKIDLVRKVPKMVEFERSLDYELTNYEGYHSINPRNKVYLQLKRNDRQNSTSDMVFTGPAGGFAASGYVIYENDETAKIEWRLNPFKFFTQALALQNTPRPDVTTLNGSRIWSSHIDGDAFNSRSEIDPTKYCSEIIFKNVLTKYKWPFSVSVVVAEINKNSEFKQIARRIYNLNWVEAASHSFSHPFYWADDYEEKDNYAQRHLPVAGYKFNIQTEIQGSIDYITKNLLPSGKKVKEFFWTGNCEPTADALKLSYDLNLLNINGSDTVFDKNRPSYTGVAPISNLVGNYRQFNPSNTNENIYTNEWHGPYYGYKFVLETMKNTESPVRIKPIDVYFHFYSGEKWAALNALQTVLKTTMQQDVAPMFLSEYTEIARDFFNVKISKLANKSWRIEHFGRCTTMRFDNTSLYPDLKKSVNLLGFRHEQGSLYVHLLDKENATIVLTDHRPQRAYLVQASHRLTNSKIRKRKIVFDTNGYGRGYFRFANLEKNQLYDIRIADETIEQKSDINGELGFRFDMNGAVKVRIQGK